MPHKDCPNCGDKIGNGSKFHYYCGWGTPTLRKQDGYLQTRCPNHPASNKSGQIMLHRAIWLDAGNEIPKGFEIHHKNEIKTDNRIENLELKTKSKHAKDHARDRGYIKNQYGVFPVINDPEEKRLHNLKLNKIGVERRKLKMGWKDKRFKYNK